MSKEPIIDEEQDNWQWVMHDRCFGVSTLEHEDWEG